MAYFFTDHPL